MTGVVFLLSHQLRQRQQVSAEPAAVVIVDSVPQREKDTLSVAKPLATDTAFVTSEVAPALVSDSVTSARRKLIMRWRQLNKAGDKLTDNEVNAIARGDTVIRTNINYWGVRKSTLRLFWDEEKQKLGWQ
jgi:hypothetical protein